MSAICRRSWPNMLAITTIGGRIDRWDNGRPAHREQVRLMEALKFERSSRYLCSEAFITFISKPHDDDGSNSCALHQGSALLRHRQLVIAVDHRFALGNPALPSAASKKSFSSVSSPIFACKVLMSTAGARAFPLDPRSNTSAANSTS